MNFVMKERDNFESNCFILEEFEISKSELWTEK